MADESGLKSSFELAMERLQKKDTEDGVTAVALTDEQKAAIAEVRNIFNSKIAEQDILQQSAVKNLAGADPAELEEVVRQFRRERERLASDRDLKLETIRGEAPGS